jgi:hypothetical protein
VEEARHCHECRVVLVAKPQHRVLNPTHHAVRMRPLLSRTPMHAHVRPIRQAGMDHARPAQRATLRFARTPLQETSGARREPQVARKRRCSRCAHPKL